MANNTPKTLTDLRLLIEEVKQEILEKEKLERIIEGELELIDELLGIRDKLHRKIEKLNNPNFFQSLFRNSANNDQKVSSLSKKLTDVNHEINHHEKRINSSKVKLESLAKTTSDFRKLSNEYDAKFQEKERQIQNFKNPPQSLLSIQTEIDKLVSAQENCEEIESNCSFLLDHLSAMRNALKKAGAWGKIDLIGPKEAGPTKMAHYKTAENELRLIKRQLSVLDNILNDIDISEFTSINLHDFSPKAFFFEFFHDNIFIDKIFLEHVSEACEKIDKLTEFLRLLTIDNKARSGRVVLNIDKLTKERVALIENH